MKAKAHSQNRFMRIITTPIRALGKARDFYVRSLMDYSDRVGYGGMAGVGAVHGAPLPRSFSATSSRSSNIDRNEDFAELVRAASSRSSIGNNKIDLNLYVQQEMMKQQSGVTRSRKMTRSGSVAMGKIDEDKPYVYGEDGVDDIKTELKYPRSRSYAPTQRNVISI